MGYTEVSTIVEGALDQEFTIDEDGNIEGEPEGASNTYDAWLEALEAEANRDGFEVEVYELYHGHEPLEGDDECACVQYLTDHHPSHTFGKADEE